MTVCVCVRVYVCVCMCVYVCMSVCDMRMAILRLSHLAVTTHDLAKGQLPSGSQNETSGK